MTCFTDEQRQVASNSNRRSEIQISDVNEAMLPLPVSKTTARLKNHQAFVAEIDGKETILATNQKLIELFELNVQAAQPRCVQKRRTGNQVVQLGCQTRQCLCLKQT